MEGLWIKCLKSQLVAKLQYSFINPGLQVTEKSIESEDTFIKQRGALSPIIARSQCMYKNHLEKW